MPRRPPPRAPARWQPIWRRPEPRSSRSTAVRATWSGRWPTGAAPSRAARSRVEEALRESERHQGEARTLRDSLAARDATIAQVLHSLGERDAQLAALQAEHAKIVPALEATSKSTTQLDADLQNARAQADARAAELQASREALAALNVQLERGESELQAARSELGAAKTQASAYLELLRTREWRRGFDQNLFREMDAQVGAADAGHGALESERDRLQAQVGRTGVQAGRSRRRDRQTAGRGGGECGDARTAGQ